jgi:MIP family channel proteins
MGNVSGGHFNPAVTIAFLFTGKINPLMTFMYVGAQLVGAISGSYILKSVAPEMGNLTITDVHPDVQLDQAFGVEVLITFVLVFTIFSCVDTRRKDLHGSFPLQIGLAVTVGALFGGKFTGGSMNPARSFGPAVTTGLWKNHWLYWLGPITGSLLAAFIYQFVLRLTCPRPPPYRRVETKDNSV